MKLLNLFIVLLYSVISYCQQSQTDSLLKVLAATKEDTTKVKLLLQLSGNYDRNANPDSIFLFANQALKISQSAGYEQGEFESKNQIADYSWSVGDYATAIKIELPLLDSIKRKKNQ